jgi:TetR/AcrR family transcriptional regulator, transcriptional repressor for nem operon
MRDRILDVAEARARSHGFNGFSFRDIATEIGVKSASIHYHFPTKADLGVALAVRYRTAFLNAVGDPRAPTPAKALQRMISVFRSSITDADAMCLCGMLGAERDGLPEMVQFEVMRFFEECQKWLADCYQAAPRPELNAATALALLEGGLLVARSLKEVKVFDSAIMGMPDAPSN